MKPRNQNPLEVVNMYQLILYHQSSKLEASHQIQWPFKFKRDSEDMYKRLNIAPQPLYLTLIIIAEMTDSKPISVPSSEKSTKKNKARGKGM